MRRALSSRLVRAGFVFSRHCSADRSTRPRARANCPIGRRPHPPWELLAFALLCSAFIGATRKRIQVAINSIPCALSSRHTRHPPGKRCHWQDRRLIEIFFYFFLFFYSLFDETRSVSSTLRTFFCNFFVFFFYSTPQIERVCK